MTQSQQPGDPIGQAGAADADQALRGAEERYRLAALATDDIIWDYDLAAGTITWNQALKRRLGHEPAGFITSIDWWADQLHPDDRPRVVDSLHAAIDGDDRSWAQEYRFRRADGGYAEVLDRGYVIRDDQRRGLRMVGAVLDLTERKMMERALRDNEQRLRLAQEVAGLGMFDWDFVSGRPAFSDAFRRLFGLKDQGAVDVNRLFHMVHPEDRPGLEAAVRAPIGDAVEGLEFRVQGDLDCEWRWIQMTSRTYRDGDGHPKRRIGVVKDITNRKRDEARLRESEENYRFTVELSPQLTWTADGDGANIEFKRPLADFADVPPDESIDWTDWVTHPDDIAYRRREWQFSLRSGRPFDVEFRVRHKDGEYRWVRSRGYPRRDANGRIVKWYGSSENIHSQRVAEQQLQRLQDELTLVARVSAMGTLASTLAHELNQPLTAVANYMAGSKRLLINHGAAAAPMILEALESASRAAIQAGEIVRRLRNLVARGEVNTQRVDLAGLVHEACELALGEPRERSIELSLEFGPSTRWVLADRIQIQQVLVNLLRNAGEAMEQSTQRTIMLSATASGEDQVIIRIEDSGPGVPSDVKRHLFSPFVTTKESGMGVGLSICRSIIEAHGGELWVEDALTGGAVFCFTLSRSAD